MKIVLSIIFPFLNASEDVGPVFKSIAEQKKIKKGQIEIIAINDGSTDDTEQQIEQHRSVFKGFADFRVIKHPSREGLAQTRYDGATTAKGEFITFVDKKLRPDNDYLYNLLNKKRAIVIGNVYMDKNRSPWDRFLAQVRKRLYFPYFNHHFEDVLLDYTSYLGFRNKGGGGVMLVRKRYYLDIASKLGKSKDANDDSKLIEQLSAIEPILKTYSAKAMYLNRTGMVENISHLYGRGPKFVDYYIRPGSRFFPIILAVAGFILINLAVLFVAPEVLLYELIALIALLVATSAYFADGVVDFVTCLTLLPVAMVAFSAGVVKGLVMKVLRLY